MAYINTEGDFTATVTDAVLEQDQTYGGERLTLKIRDAKGDTATVYVGLNEAEPEKLNKALDEIAKQFQWNLAGDEKDALVGKIGKFFGKIKPNGKLGIYLSSGKEVKRAPLSSRDRLAALAAQRAQETGATVSAAKAAQTVEDDSVPF